VFPKTAPALLQLEFGEGDRQPMHDLKKQQEDIARILASLGAWPDG